MVTNVHTILYWVNKKDILGNSPANPTSDSQFNHWEVPIQTWWAQNKYKYTTTTWDEKPTTLDDVHTDAAKPIVTILEPNNTKIYSPDQTINFKINSAGIFPLKKIDVFMNDTYLETLEPPFNLSFTPREFENLQGSNELKIISYDTAYNRSQTSVVFKVAQ